MLVNKSMVSFSSNFTLTQRFFSLGRYGTRELIVPLTKLFVDLRPNQTVVCFSRLRADILMIKKERKIDIWRRTPSCWTHKHIACNEKKVQTIKSSNDTHFSELIICFSQSRSSHGVVDGWINMKSCWMTESTVDHKKCCNMMWLNSFAVKGFCLGN